MLKPIGYNSARPMKILLILANTKTQLEPSLSVGYLASYLKKYSKLKVYKLHKNGTLQGNILEWLALVVFLFAFFTFLYNIFLYIIIISFIIGVIGFTIRKFQIVSLSLKLSHT